MSQNDTNDNDDIRPVPPMNIQGHEGDLVREAINRDEYWEHKALGELREDDGRFEYEILVVARVTDSGTPKLTAHVGGEYDHGVYVGGTAISRTYGRLWALDAAFGELFREYDLEMIDVPTEK